jgi:ligand-binding sensor domain-containing protein
MREYAHLKPGNRDTIRIIGVSRGTLPIYKTALLLSDVVIFHGKMTTKGDATDMFVDRQLPGDGVFLRSVLARYPRTLPIALLLLTLLAVRARAERLPLRIYSTTDGLPSNQINCVKRDSRGFLWFCTAEGLSRFDGYTFTNYGSDQGLPDRVVTDFLERRSGDYWVATLRGLARFNPKPSPKAPMFAVYRPGQPPGAEQANALFEDRQRTIWVGANAGVFQLVQAGGQWALRRPDLGLAINVAAEILLEDHDGNLWIGV